MKLLKQTKLHGEGVRGNCMATCIACVLDLDIKDVPEFEDILRPRNWNIELILWLKSIGYYIHAEYIHKYLDADNNRIYEFPAHDVYIVGGDSPRGEFKHCVIFKDNEMYHDPHPDNTGILSIDDYWYIYPMVNNEEGLWYGNTYAELSELL